jgi:hypothetical protein
MKKLLQRHSAGPKSQTASKPASQNHESQVCPISNATFFLMEESSGRASRADIFSSQLSRRSRAERGLVMTGSVCTLRFYHSHPCPFLRKKGPFSQGRV